MKKYTFPTEEEYFDRSDKLEVIRKNGTKAAITDFSILLGGYVSDSYHLDNDNSLSGRTGVYWTKSPYGSKSVLVVDHDGDRSYYYVYGRLVGARPALSFSSISDIPTNGVSGRVVDDVLVVEFGYYPQTAASKELQNLLNQEFSRRSLRKTGNGYTTDSRKYDEYNESFQAQRLEEYEYRGKRYVRVKANSYYDGSEFTLSNNVNYKDGDFVWIEVEPVEWIVDEESKTMIAKKILFAGVQFNKEYNYRIEDFDKTDIKTFMDRDFARDLEQSRTIERSISSDDGMMPSRKSRLEKLNPDSSTPASRSKMTDTEIIHNWIEAGESVLLRGPSGIGKTERLKSLYPDLIYIKLTNNMFPEKVVGSVNLQTGQSIPPDFAKTAIMQEATEDEKKLIEENIQNIYDLADTIYERSKRSDKKVVIMLDELLNVKPAVQGLVYTLVLNRLVEIGKGLKLPDNVVIVATGNQKKYSSVAEDLAEPLEKRFDHILDMEPKVGEWITGYAIPQKVHPAVIGYILSEYNKSGKSENINNMQYFYEEPEVGESHLDANGCKGRTNDPRGWTSISNTLYNFEENLRSGKYKGKNVEDILLRSINSKLRDDWASYFFDFYNLPTLTPEEVVKGMGKGYTQADLPQDISERFAFMTALITADESQVEACREFIRENCDPEYLSIYDIYWAGNDERRMEKISELQEMSLIKHRGEEAKKYAQEGIDAYEDIGKMYNEYLMRTKEDIRGEDDVRV